MIEEVAAAVANWPAHAQRAGVTARSRASVREDHARVWSDFAAP
jgi:hypothetical protein